MTQGELAEAVYVNQPRISDFERGEVEIGVAELGYIALALEKPITLFIPPKSCGATTKDLTPVQKEIIHYLNQATDEADFVVLEQAKSLAKAARTLKERKYREGLLQEEEEIAGDKRARKQKGKK